MIPRLFYGYSFAQEQRFKAIRERVRREMEIEWKMVVKKECLNK